MSRPTRCSGATAARCSALAQQPLGPPLRSCAAAHQLERHLALEHRVVREYTTPCHPRRSPRAAGSARACARRGVTGAVVGSVSALDTLSSSARPFTTAATAGGSSSSSRCAARPPARSCSRAFAHECGDRCCRRGAPGARRLALLSAHGYVWCSSMSHEPSWPRRSITHSRRASGALRSAPALETALVALVETSRAAWPKLDLEPASSSAPRRELQPDSDLARVHAADL